MEGGGSAVAELRRPHRDRGAFLDLLGAADHAARAAADQIPRLQSLVHALERDLGRRQVRSRGEHDREVDIGAVERPDRGLPGLDRALARVGIRGQAASDANPHHGDDTPRMASRTAPPAVIALFGPTGVGKTAVAVALAEGLRAQRGEDPVAVSADALQVYRGLEALTGVATPDQRAGLEHRLISFLPVDARFSVGEYAELAHAEIDALLDAGRRPIVLGGTGLYLRAALADLDLRPPPPEGVRERLEAELAARGAPALHAELRHRAPWAAEPIDANDRHRIVRALELLEAGELAPPPERSQLWTERTRHPTLLVGLTMDRDGLYTRINARVDAMVAAGAVEEVRAAHAAGASETARGALGFAELLAGDVEAMKRHTRSYARRQLTWMRKLAGVRVIDATARAPAELAAELLRLAASPPRAGRSG